MRMKLVAVLGVACLWSSATFSADCTKTSVGLIPLKDGPGLYPDGMNTPAAAHVLRGSSLAAALKARPKNVLLSAGMSNSNQKFERFRRDELATTDKAANLVIVNGASGHQTAEDWANPNDDAYVYANDRLTVHGATSADVGVLWVHLTEGATADINAWKVKVLNDARQALLTMTTKYPNVSMLLLSSRAYGGYETVGRGGIGLNPEPYAHAQGPLMKQLITEHLQDSLLPDRWIAWAPYFWADGLIARSDGLIWKCSDFQSDGVHPSGEGAMKASSILRNYFRGDAVARAWFLQTP